MEEEEVMVMRGVLGSRLKRVREPEHLDSVSLLAARKKAEVVRWRRGTRRRDGESISHVCV